MVFCHFLEEPTEIRQGEGEFSKLVKFKSPWKQLELLDLPGSDPGAQSKVSFTYWISSREIIASKDHYYLEGFGWSHHAWLLRCKELYGHLTTWDLSGQLISGQGIGDKICSYFPSREQSTSFVVFSFIWSRNKKAKNQINQINKNLQKTRNKTPEDFTNSMKKRRDSS